jgi:hypothetical protein
VRGFGPVKQRAALAARAQCAALLAAYETASAPADAVPAPAGVAHTV